MARLAAWQDRGFRPTRALDLPQFRDSGRQGNEIRDEREGCEGAVSGGVPEECH